MKSIDELSLSKKHKYQLLKALNRQENKFAADYLIPTIESWSNNKSLGFPHLFRKEHGSFMSFDLEEMIDENNTGENDISWSSVTQQTCLFTNPLGQGQQDRNKKPGTSSGFTPPSERIVNAGWWVITHEYDGDDQDALEMQLDWFSGKPENCQFASVHRALSKYADYRGYCVVFSGNKSLHIHTLWDIRHLSLELSKKAGKLVKSLWKGDVQDESLSNLHRSNWVEVAKIINIGLGTQIDFDRRLASYVQKRRSPWGIRTFSKKVKLHGFTPGDQIQQVVVQERLSSRCLAPSEADALATYEKCNNYVEPTRSRTKKPSTRRISKSSAAHVIPELASYLRNQGWDKYPEPVDIQFDGTTNIVFFKNNVSDKHPSTLLKGDYRCLLQAGRGAQAAPIYLPNELTLDQTLNLLFPSKQMFFNVMQNSIKETKYSMLFGFENISTDILSTRKAADKILKNIAESDGITLVQAAEGMGKTHSFLNSSIDVRICDEANRQRNADKFGSEAVFKRGFTIIACREYGQLEEKYHELMNAEFNPGRAITFQSVGKLYALARHELRVIREITTTEAGNLGHPHLLHAIQNQQPTVYEMMGKLRDAMWATSIGTPVFDPNAHVFMVHELLKTWPHSFYAKAFLHPEFPDDFNQVKIEECARQMGAYRVIYDEINWPDLMELHEAWKVEFAIDVEKHCKSEHQKPWNETPLSDRVASYSDNLRRQNRKTDDILFDDCDQIIRSRFKPEHRIEVDPTNFPFGKGNEQKNIYATCKGKPYYCKPQRWYKALNCPIVVLTTEDLPRLIAVGINKRSDEQNSFNIVNLTNTPHLFQDYVPLMFNEMARMNSRADPKENVETLASNLLDAGCDVVISNGIKSLEQQYPGRIINHNSARGRNDLQGKSIATLATYPSVSQFEHYCILGQLLNIPDPVVVAYRDMIFQDLGRNLGFRRTSGQSLDDHIVVMKPSLFRDLKQFSSESILNSGSDRYRFNMIP